MSIKRILFIAAVLGLALQAAFALAANAPVQETKPLVLNGLVDVHGLQPSMLQVLHELCVAANLEVFVFEHIEDSQLSLAFSNRPVEEALRSLLRGRNYSVVYRPEGNSTGLRLVPVGKTKKHEAAAISVQGASSVASPAVSGQGSPAEPSQGGAVVPSSGMSISYASSGGVEAAESTGNTEPSSDQVSSEPPVPAQNASSPLRTASNQMTPEAKLERLIAMYEQRIASGVSDKEYEINMKLSGGGYVVHDRDRVQFWTEALERHAGR